MSRWTYFCAEVFSLISYIYGHTFKNVPTAALSVSFVQNVWSFSSFATAYANRIRNRYYSLYVRRIFRSLLYAYNATRELQFIIIIIIIIILHAARLLTAVNGTDRIPTSTLAYHVLFYLRWTPFFLFEGVEQTYNWALASGRCCVYFITEVKGKGKSKAIPLEAWTGPKGSRRMRLSDFKTIGTWRW
jgi:hypothetical protein